MESTAAKLYQATGTEAPWYRGRDLTDEQRDRFRRNTLASQAAKRRAERGQCTLAKYPIPIPRLSSETLMPMKAENGLRALSLFSGGAVWTSGLNVRDSNTSRVLKSWNTLSRCYAKPGPNGGFLAGSTAMCAKSIGADIAAKLTCCMEVRLAALQPCGLSLRCRRYSRHVSRTGACRCGD